jgi:glycosyltransferase involved in cell wall biosynthesis
VNQPRVSVLIPTYNYACFLAEAVESVLMQDFQDFELIIVDDCSADNTAEVVKPICARDARVHFSVNATNLGMVNNWNHCLKRARGEYVKFLFGDDKLSDPQALGKLITLLRNNPSAVLAASARTILDEKSSVTDIWRPLRDGCHNGRKIITACFTGDANLIGEPSAVLFRKKDGQRGFDSKFLQNVDIEMWFHLLENGDLAYTREPLCAFRQHARQQSKLNRVAGTVWMEREVLFTNYATKPWLPRKAHFPQLLALRRLRQEHQSAANHEMFERERRLTRQFGERWYLFYWVCYRLTRPFQNLNRSIRKRMTRLLWVPPLRRKSARFSRSQAEGLKPQALAVSR